MYEVLGTVGSMIVCISSLPQIIKTLKTKKVHDLSISYMIILMIGILLMMIYSLYVGDVVFILGNGLSVLSTGILIILWFRYELRSNLNLMGRLRELILIMRKT